LIVGDERQGTGRVKPLIDRHAMVLLDVVVEH
jgi:hypothetical protein